MVQMRVVRLLSLDLSAELGEGIMRSGQVLAKQTMLLIGGELLRLVRGPLAGLLMRLLWRGEPKRGVSLVSGCLRRRSDCVLDAVGLALPLNHVLVLQSRGASSSRDDDRPAVGASILRTVLFPSDGNHVQPQAGCEEREQIHRLRVAIRCLD